jgi:hypothetical protein
MINAVYTGRLEKQKPDYITVLQTDGRANKLIERDAQGNVSKSAGTPISSAYAWTYNVPDAASMIWLLTAIADNPNVVIIPSGYFPGTEPPSSEPRSSGLPFVILSKREMADRFGIVGDDNLEFLGGRELNGYQHFTRLKSNMLAGSWVIFDRDEVKGMPPELSSMTDPQWVDAMADLIPGFKTVPKVMVPSSTGRVLVDGQPMAASGRHYYVQIEDGDDLERFGATLLQHSFLKRTGFERPLYSKSKPDEIIGHRQWSILDPTTFSRERIVYEGSPTIMGDGLALSPFRIEEI